MSPSPTHNVIDDANIVSDGDLEQIGMGASTLENNLLRSFINFIDKHPIALDMTFKGVFPFSMQWMVFTLRRQRLFVDDHTHYFNKFVHILMTFFGSGKFLFELSGTERFKHKSASQLLKQFLKRVAPLGRNLSPEHGVTFLNGGDGFGVGHIVFGGADGAFAVRVKPVFGRIRNRSEGNNGLPRRHFTWNINGQPMADRYIDGLCNTHALSIA